MCAPTSLSRCAADRVDSVPRGGRPCAEVRASFSVPGVAGGVVRSAGGLGRPRPWLLVRKSARVVGVSCHVPVSAFLQRRAVQSVVLGGGSLRPGCGSSRVLVWSQQTCFVPSLLKLLCVSQLGCFLLPLFRPLRCHDEVGALHR